MAITQNDIIYFILTDRFHGVANSNAGTIDKDNPYHYHGGNFAGIVEKIPYLKTLGVTALWITPVYLQCAGPNETTYGYHGYWSLDFNAINPYLYHENGTYEKGSKLYLKDLVDTLHANGLKLVLDMVVNHTGYNHPALIENAENPTPIRANWFNPDEDSSQDLIKGRLAGLPDFNLDNIDVADYHITTILSWIEQTGIDAIRMDTAKHIEKSFWNQFKTLVQGNHPQITLIGEVLEFDVPTIAKYQEEWAFDSIFDFPLQQAIKDVFIYDKPLTNVVSPFNTGEGILDQDIHYTNQNKLVTLLDNHDLEARFFSLALKHVGGEENKQYAVWVQKLAMSFLFTVRGIPQIYYGTEVGMEGWADPDNRRNFNWNLFDENYHVKPEFKFEKEIFEHTQKLISLRKGNDALMHGNFITLYVDDFVLAYLRYHENSAVIVIIHNGWLEMPNFVRISINTNPNIPTRIKQMLNNRILTCQLNDSKILVNNGVFEAKLSRKSAMILK